jgi:hypothetical protein
LGDERARPHARGAHGFPKLALGGSWMRGRKPIPAGVRGWRPEMGNG